MPKNILIVEDQMLLALDIEATLIEAGYEVVGIATTTSDALRLAKRERVDLATMDVQLARGDSGVEAAVALHALGVRSLFVSGNLDHSVRQSAQNAEPYGYLGKPVDPNALISALKLIFET